MLRISWFVEIRFENAKKIYNLNALTLHRNLTGVLPPCGRIGELHQFMMKSLHFYFLKKKFQIKNVRKYCSTLRKCTNL